MSPVSTMSSTTTTSRPVEVELDVVEDPHPPESGAKREIAMKSIATSMPADRPGEVGEEDHRALEHADEHDAVGVVGRDLRAEPLDDRRELVALEQRRRDGRSTATVSR